MGMTHHDRRWSALRLQAKRRDGFQCVKCGARHRLEVDHIQPAKKAPLLAYDLANLQTLCSGCHSLKTAIENGVAPLDPERRKWRDFLNLKGTRNAGICENPAASV